ncbi:hypothetical protein Tco_0344303 [Tanacetum coccineum]
MAFFYFSDFKACSTFDGASYEYKLAKNAFASLDRFPLAMLATGYIELMEVFSRVYHFGGIPLFDLAESIYFSRTSIRVGFDFTTAIEKSPPTPLFPAAASPLKPPSDRRPSHMFSLLMELVLVEMLSKLYWSSIQVAYFIIFHHEMVEMDFLLAIPIDGLGQHMSPVEYHAILKYHLLIPLFPVDADVLFDICKRVGISDKKEAPVNFLTDPSDGKSTLRPADILVFGWVGGKHACVNLTGVSPLGYRKNEGKKKWVTKDDKSHHKCEECGMSRYTKEQCFCIVSYPDWWTDGNKKGTKSAKTKKEKVPTTNTSSINKENICDGRRSDGGFRGLAAARNKGVGGDFSIAVVKSKPKKTHIRAANRERMDVKIGGMIKISPRIKLPNCLYVASLLHKLLSISHVTKNSIAQYLCIQPFVSYRISEHDGLLGVALRERDCIMSMK